MGEEIGKFSFKNIKKIVIVVILIVISIFLCWRCFCRNNYLSDKIRGGTSQNIVLPLTVGGNFVCTGLEITGEPFFVVLNAAGRKKIEDTVVTFAKYARYVQGFIDFDYDYNANPLSLPNMIKNPLAYFGCGGRSGSVLSKAIPLHYTTPKTPKPKTKADYIRERKTFDFKELLEVGVDKLTRGTIEKIVTAYTDLVNFLKTNFPGYIELVNFVGQPSVSSTGKTAVTAIGRYPLNIEVSPNLSGNLKGILKSELRKFLRCWFGSGDLKKVFDNYAYIKKISEEKQGGGTTTDYTIDYITESETGQELTPFESIPNDLARIQDFNVSQTKTQQPGNQEESEEEDQSDVRGWGIADVFPAHKLFEMIYFLFSLMEQYRDDAAGKTRLRYFELMASYIIYANLFNMYCGLRMESKWNQKIGCLYVYNKVGFDKKNIMSTMEPVKEELLVQSLAENIAEELCNLPLTEDTMNRFLGKMTGEGKALIFEIYNKRDKMGELRTKFDEYPANKDQLEDVIRGLLIYKDDFVAYMLEMKEKIRVPRPLP